MAPWGDSKLFFCLLFIACCCTVALAELPMDCCLSAVSGRVMDKSAFAHIRKQYSGQGCSLDATILVTRRGRMLCVASTEDWLQEVEEHIKFLHMLCKKTNFKGKRCTGVKPEYV